MSKLRVGASKKSINPTPDMYPIPGTITDFGIEPMQQEEAYDEMHVRAIAVEQNKTTTILLTYELAGAPAFQDFPKEIAEACGISPEFVFIMGTHNHSAPRYERNLKDPEVKVWAERYEKIVHDAGIEACKEAVAKLQPAKCGYGEIDSYVNVNRNLYSFGGYWVEGRNIAGYSDKTLSIIKFTDLENNIICAFLNHATHCTNVYMLKDIDHKAKTSGNFSGVASKFVEAHYGGDMVAMWTSGAAGDQNPLLSHGLQYEYPDGYTTQVQYPDGTGYMEMEYMGRLHGVDCCKGLDAITRLSDMMPISHDVKEILLPAQKSTGEWPPKDFSSIRNGGQGVRNYDEVPFGKIPAPALVPEQIPGDPRHLYLHLLKIGNIAITFANGEIYSQIGKAMKEASPYKNFIIVTHHYGPKCNYIFDEGSKDVLLPMAYCGVIPGAGDKLIVDGELDLFDSILAHEN